MKLVTAESISLDAELANLYQRRQALDQLILALELYARLEERREPTTAEARTFAQALAV